MKMSKYTVRYELEGYVYETKVRTATSGGALRWVEVAFPNAKNIAVV